MPLAVHPGSVRRIDREDRRRKRRNLPAIASGQGRFPELLPGIAPGYLRTEVVDATGLEGGWDFTFSFSPVGVLQLGRTQGGDNAEASDPTSAITLFDAMTKQLGLKLDTQKRPTPVLVIDHIERKPIEN